MSKDSNRVWEEYFGDATCAEDAFGVKICKSNYGQEVTNGWNIDHTWPLEPHGDDYDDGSDSIWNYQPLSYDANNEKANRINGKVLGIEFSVSKWFTDNGGNVVGRMKIKLNDIWYWAYDEPDYEEE